MKINKKQLQNIISESIKRVLKEWDSDDWDEKVDSTVYLVVDLKTLDIVKSLYRIQYMKLAMNPEGDNGYAMISSNDFSGAYRGKCTFSGSYYQPPEYDDDCFGTCDGFEVDEFIVPERYEEYEDELREKFIEKNSEEIKEYLVDNAEFV